MENSSRVNKEKIEYSDNSDNSEKIDKLENLENLDKTNKNNTDKQIRSDWDNFIESVILPANKQFHTQLCQETTRGASNCFDYENKINQEVNVFAKADTPDVNGATWLDEDNKQFENRVKFQEEVNFDDFVFLNDNEENKEIDFNKTIRAS